MNIDVNKILIANTISLEDMSDVILANNKSDELFISVESAISDYIRLLQLQIIAKSDDSPIVREAINVGLESILTTIGFSKNEVKINSTSNNGVVTNIGIVIKRVLEAIRKAWRNLIDWLLNTWDRLRLLIGNYEGNIEKLSNKVDRIVSSIPTNMTVSSASIYTCFNGSSKDIFNNVLETISYRTNAIGVSIKYMPIFVNLYNELDSAASKLKKIVESKQKIDSSNIFQLTTSNQIITDVNRELAKYKNIRVIDKPEIAMPTNSTEPVTISSVGDLNRSEINTLTREQMRAILEKNKKLVYELKSLMQYQSNIRKSNAYFNDTIGTLGIITDNMRADKSSAEDIAVIKKAFNEMQTKLQNSSTLFFDLYRKIPTYSVQTLQQSLAYVKLSINAYESESLYE